MIEYAEVRLNDGDGNDYINFYVDGVIHSYILEDVFEQMQAAAELERMTSVIEAARLLETIARDFLEDCSHLDNPRTKPEETYRLAYDWFKNYGKHFDAALAELDKVAK